MSRPKIHAPDGGIFNHALCEEPTGDTSMLEQYVTCSDCLDALDDASWALTNKLNQKGFVFLGPRSDLASP